MLAHPRANCYGARTRARDSPQTWGTAFCGAVLCPPASLGVLTVLFQSAQPQYSTPMTIPGRAARVRPLVNQHARVLSWESHVTPLSVFKRQTVRHRGPHPSLKSLSPHHRPTWTKSRLGRAETRPVLRDPTAASRVGPAPAAPPPTSGRTAVTCPDRSGRRGFSRVEYPVFPSAGSGATFPFRLRVPERRGRPDRGAERRRGR